MPGPFQVIAVGFGPGSDFEGRVLAEVSRLQGRGVLRLVDLLFVAKNEDGETETLAVGDDEDFGALLSGIIPLDAAGRVGASGGREFTGLRSRRCAGPGRIPAAGRGAGLVLIEHGWAEPLFDAIAETGGTLLGEGFLTAEAGLLAGAEVGGGRGGG